jgi:hypothetical protein
VAKGAEAPQATASRVQVKLYDRGVQVSIESTTPGSLASRLTSGDFDAALLQVWLVTREPALALAQIAAAAAGPEQGGRVLARAAAAPAALASLSSSLEAELRVVPLYVTSARVAASAGVEGLALCEDGTIDVANVWRMPEGTLTSPDLDRRESRARP